MTKKRYPKSARGSRATRRYPFERRYDTLATNDPHVVDDIIDKIPPIHALDRRLVRLSKRIQDDVRDIKRYVAFEDLRLEQRTLREQAYFDAGHQQGRIDGVVESLDSSVRFSREARKFVRQIQIARLASGLTVERATAVLLECARGLVLGERLRLRLRGRP
ncbi:MAG TPA: hypothetical protein VHO06_20070 [Polyangia bacterium]|nr:hypothetical protein [Polyangia bacterium]